MDNFYDNIDANMAAMQIEDEDPEPEINVAIAAAAGAMCDQYSEYQTTEDEEDQDDKDEENQDASKDMDDASAEDNEPNIFGWKKSYCKVAIAAAAAAATEDAEDDNQDAGKDMDDNNQDAGKDMDDNNQDAGKDMTVERDEAIAASSVMNNMLDSEAIVDAAAGAGATVKPAAGAGTAGATGLDVVLYDGLKVEGLIIGGVTVQKRNIIKHANLHAQVVQKTANIIDSMQSMDIYSLYWIEQHLKECKKLYNNDCKTKKDYVKYVKSAVRIFQMCRVWVGGWAVSEGWVDRWAER
jgi:hypothetical protein